MKAWVINRIGIISPASPPLVQVDMTTPEPGPGEIRLKVRTCGICHTELDEIEGRTPPNVLPRIPGHQVVGIIDKHGPDCGLFPLGTRVGVAWLHSACGTCPLCRDGRENLCPDFRGTGRDVNGGYAEFMTVPEAFAIPIPEAITDIQAAPLLCAGAVGYRALRLAGLTEHANLGLTGFGASAHLVLQMARHQYPTSRLAVFARSVDQQEFARELGADWAGGTCDKPPFPLTAIIDTTPAWQPVVSAMARLEPGGRLIINAIRKEERDKASLLSLDYADHLWMEKELKSVANVTRRDVKDCLELAVAAGIQSETQLYDFEQANQALCDLKRGDNRGAKVLVMA